MNGRFAIYLRRRQNTFEGQNVVVKCNPATGVAEYEPGTVDNDWYDYTNYIEQAEKLSFTWDKINNGNSNSETNPDGSNYDKGITSDLIFFDSAQAFISDWLLTTECQMLNAVEVKIVDLVAGGTYRIFEIKNDNISEVYDDPCRFSIKLREQDNNWHCIHKTFIWDNWQNWFNKDNTSLKEQPCFLTCIEPRPRMINSARMALMLFFFSNPLVALVSGSIKDDARRILNTNRFVDAPLIRTYLENVAGKCGLALDTIFNQGQQWENICLYYPQAGFMHEHDGDSVASPSLVFHFDNRWLITIAELLDKLKTVFAAEWYVTPSNTIVFKHTKDLIAVAPIYDFTLTGSVPFYDLVTDFNGEKKPAYGRYEYQTDGSDLASQELSTLYSDIIDYDGPANNPMLEGERSKSFAFAPTGFIRDGRAKDYLELLIEDGRVGALILVAILAVVVVALTAGVLSFGAAMVLLASYLGWSALVVVRANVLNGEFVTGPTYTGAVRLTSEQVLSPRLLLWDGLTPQRAKVVKNVTLPTANTFYNPDSVAYDVRNKIDIDNPDKVVYNYPLYFDGDFQGNLFDGYHEVIDNPLKSKESHREAKFNVDLCEDMLVLFGVFENQYAVIGKVVKILKKDNYDVYVRIGNIQIDYDSNKINIKGKILRRA